LPASVALVFGGRRTAKLVVRAKAARSETLKHRKTNQMVTDGRYSNGASRKEKRCCCRAITGRHRLKSFRANIDAGSPPLALGVDKCVVAGAQPIYPSIERAREPLVWRLAIVPIASALARVCPIPTQLRRRSRRNCSNGNHGPERNTCDDRSVIGPNNPRPHGSNDHCPADVHVPVNIHMPTRRRKTRRRTKGDEPQRKGGRDRKFGHLPPSVRLPVDPKSQS
jgi:hypothetical protein